MYDSQQQGNKNFFCPRFYPQAEGHGFEPQINHILGPSEGQPVAVNPVYMVRMKAGFDTGLGF